ncbi:glycoside hydrolase family 1 protein [Coprobacillus sp. AF16-47]|jgi:6-phospho-beta-glucosidase|nr:glycoside hydrolase family 1 protein [Coprobacillus sp. AF16-47]
MGFPKGFLWGGSISAAQIEGGWNEGGKSPVLVDYCTAGSTKERRQIWYLDKNGQRAHRNWEAVDELEEGCKFAFFDDLHYTNHVASDFYHRYKEDLALFKEMGYTTFNTSISWARIYPHGIKGGVNQEGVEFYRDVFKTAKEYGMDPVITLYKYDEPVSLLEQHGGWRNRAMIDEFVEFARVCFSEYKDYVNKWMTFNEINIIMPMDGQKTERNQRNLIYLHNQLVAAARATIVAHEIDPNLKVGCMLCTNMAYPLTPDPLDAMERYRKFQDFFCYSADTQMRGYYPPFAKRIWEEYDVTLEVTKQDKEDLMNGKSDFIGFSYYSSGIVTTHKVDDDNHTGGNILGTVKNPYLKANAWGWQIDPVGFRHMMHLINDRYNAPMFDVENGIGLIEKEGEDGICHDPARIEYHREHIKEMKKAVEEGVNLFGYTTWGCIDLVSAGTGQMDKKYGFIYVDMDDEGNGDLHRSRKDSFYWYKKIIASNGEDLD